MKATTFTKNDIHYSLIGKSLIEALQTLKRKGVEYRVLETGMNFDCMYVNDRINLVVNEKRTVEDAYIG